jgi:hypothetical protein
MTTKDTDTRSSGPATEPLALRLSEGLGPNAVAVPDLARTVEVLAYRLGQAHEKLRGVGGYVMTEAQCVEALRLADRLDSSDPEFDDCAAAASVLRECVKLARAEPAATELRVAAGNALTAAALGVVAHMEGRLPVRGWLRDNDKSREALAELLRVLGA